MQNLIPKINLLTIDSREVAKMIPKEHRHLLRDIDIYSSYLAEPKIGLSEFWKESSYKDRTNRKLKCYLITKKGCEFIAHKMTGKKGGDIYRHLHQSFPCYGRNPKAPKAQTEMVAAADSPVQVFQRCSVYDTGGFGICGRI